MAIVTMTQGGQSSAAVNGQSLEYITQQVLQMMPGCPDSLAQSVLTNVIRDFYNKSNGWQEVIGPYTIVPGVNTINLNPVDQYSQCHYVLRAFVYPDTTGGLTPRYLHPSANLKFGPDTGPPLQYYMDGPDTMVLYPVPDILYGNILYCQMSLMPVLNVGRLPNVSITHHFDGLFFGTLWRLGMMPNKSFTVKDSQLLGQWNRLYRQQIMLARDIAARAFSSVDGKIWFPNFAGRASQNPNAAAGWSR